MRVLAQLVAIMFIVARGGCKKRLALIALALGLPGTAHAQLPSVFRHHEASVLDREDPLRSRLDAAMKVQSTEPVSPQGALRLASAFRIPEDRGPVIASIFPSYSSASFEPSPWGIGWGETAKIKRFREQGPIRYDGRDDLTSPWGILRCRKKNQAVCSEYQSIGAAQGVRAVLANNTLVVHADGAEWTFQGFEATAQKFKEYLLKKVIRADGWRTVITWKFTAGSASLLQVAYGSNDLDPSVLPQYRIQFSYEAAGPAQRQESGAGGFMTDVTQLVKGVEIRRMNAQGAMDLAWRYELERRWIERVQVGENVFNDLQGRRPFLTAVREYAPSAELIQETRYEYDDGTEFRPQRITQQQGDGPGLFATAKWFYGKGTPELIRTYPKVEDFLTLLNVVDMNGDGLPEIEYRELISAVSPPDGEFAYRVFDPLTGVTKTYPDTSLLGNRFKEECRPRKNVPGLEADRHFVRLARLAPTLAEPQVIAFSAPGVNAVASIHICRPTGEIIQTIDIKTSSIFSNIAPLQWRQNDTDWTRKDTLVADVNGDGRPDIVRVLEGQLMVVPNSSELNVLSFGRAYVLNLVELHRDQRHEVVDYNGDGLPDFVEYDTAKSVPVIRVWPGLAAISEFPGARFDGAISMKVIGAELAKCSLQLLDVTGDRYADLLTRCPNRGAGVIPNLAQDLKIRDWDLADGWTFGPATRMVPLANGLSIFTNQPTGPTWLPIPLRHERLTRVTNTDGLDRRFRFRADERSFESVRPPPVLIQVMNIDPSHARDSMSYIHYRTPAVSGSPARLLGFSQVTLSTPLEAPSPLGATFNVKPYLAPTKNPHRIDYFFGWGTDSKPSSERLTRVREMDVETPDGLKLTPIGIQSMTNYDYLEYSPAENIRNHRLSGTASRMCTGVDCLDTAVARNYSSIPETDATAPWCPKRVEISTLGGVSSLAAVSPRRELTLSFTRVQPGQTRIDNVCRWSTLTVKGVGPSSGLDFSETDFVDYSPNGVILARGKKTSAEKVQTVWTYDKGRMKSVSYPDRRSVSFTYDPRGRIATVADDTGLRKVLTYLGNDDGPAQIEHIRGTRRLTEHNRYDARERPRTRWYAELGTTETVPSNTWSYKNASTSAPATVLTYTRVNNTAGRWAGSVLDGTGNVSAAFSRSGTEWVVSGATRHWERSSCAFGEFTRSIHSDIASEIATVLKDASGHLGECVNAAHLSLGQTRSLRAKRIPSAAGTPSRFAVDETVTQVGLGAQQVTRRALGVTHAATLTQWLDGESNEMQLDGLPGGTPVTHVYDALGRLRRASSSERVETVQYDALGRIEKKSSGTRTQVFKYLYGTILTREVTERGASQNLIRRTTKTYAKARLATMSYEAPYEAPNVPKLNWSWDYVPVGGSNAGLLDKVTGPGVVRRYSYDVAFRVEGEELSFPSAKVTLKTSWKLGFDGSPLGVSRHATLNGNPLGSGFDESFELEADARVKTATRGPLTIDQVQYGRGRLASARLSAGGKTYNLTFTRDAGTGELLGAGLSSGADVMSVSRRFDMRGLPEVETATWGTNSNASRTYAYDDWARLYKVTGAQTESYAMDAGSKLTNASNFRGAGNVQRSLSAVQWGARRVGLDESGSATSIDTKPLHRGADGQVTAFEGTQYVHDEAGRRIAVLRNGAMTLIGDSFEISAAAESYPIAFGEITLGDVVNGDFKPTLSDFRGSPWVTPMGPIIRTAYGAVAPSSLEHHARFAGGHFDATTRTVRLGVRDYDPVLGQFLSEDPVSMISTGPSVYVLSNPVALVDPDGRAPCIMSKFGISCIAGVEAESQAVYDQIIAQGKLPDDYFSSLPGRWFDAGLAVVTDAALFIPNALYRIGMLQMTHDPELIVPIAFDLLALSSFGPLALEQYALARPNEYLHLHIDAIAARNTLAAQCLERGEKPGVVIAGYNEITGEIFAAQSSWLADAEVMSYFGLGQPSNIKLVSPMRPGNLKLIPVCENCERFLGRGAFPDVETQFKLDLKLK